MRTERECGQVSSARWVMVLPKVGLQHDLVMSVTRKQWSVSLLRLSRAGGPGWEVQDPWLHRGSATSAGLNGEACSHEWMSLGSRLCMGLPEAVPVPFSLGRSPLASPL